MKENKPVHMYIVNLPHTCTRLRATNKKLKPSSHNYSAQQKAKLFNWKQREVQDQNSLLMRLKIGRFQMTLISVHNHVYFAPSSLVHIIVVSDQMKAQV